MTLNDKQARSLQFVLEGHNVVILGPAGTGKSYLVMRIYEHLNELGKKCAVTATTGIACSMYKDVHGMTIHRWSGVGDGRYGPSEIKHRIRNSVKCKDVVDRIMETDVLVIDECSMMSKRFLECLHEVCSMKNDKHIFGGIQVILVGDFLQLSPVPCARYSEDGSFCFESDIYKYAFPHSITLNEVVRQNEKDFIYAIREASLGDVSNETVNFIESLNRPLQNESHKLFSTNDMVDDHNRQCILDHPGFLFEFPANDNGEKKYLKDIKAARNLWIKIGIPVILLKNLTDELVNGLQGEVYDITDDGTVLVEFPSMKNVIHINRVRFEVFDPRKNAVVAVREQYPLKPAYGLTIHKSQGMTLERVEVDCRNIFKPGQLGVAMGRAKTAQGLRVVNFNVKACIKQPDKIMEYVNDIDRTETKEDKTCCNLRLRMKQLNTTMWTTEEMVEMDTAEEMTTTYMDELDDDFNDVIANLDTNTVETIHLPEDININKICENLKCKTTVSPLQYENNLIMSRINLQKLEVFIKQEYRKLTSLLEECPCGDSGQISSKNLGQFYSSIHHHANSLEFRMNCMKLFENEPGYRVSHQRICFNISMELRKYILSDKASKVKERTHTVTKRTITDASRARVRYVGGYCVAKCTYKYVTKKSSHRYSTKENDKLIYEEAKCALTVLNSLNEQEQNVMAMTEEPDSLLDTSRRQNMNRGLTNISDSLFKFFIKMTDNSLNLFTTENLNINGSDLFNQVFKDILSSVPLYEEFVHICVKQQAEETLLVSCTEHAAGLLNDMTMKAEQITEIYSYIVKKFLMVLLNQFRKDTLESCQVKKTMAHRKQVQVSKTRKQAKLGKDSIDPVKSDKLVPKSPQPGPSSESPAPGPSHISNETISVSTSEEDSNIKCKVCDTIERGIEWIQCDSCDLWLHRNCAGLRHHKRWKKFQKKGAQFMCQECE